MARSSTGGLRGAAAAADLREMREHIWEIQTREWDRQDEEKRRRWRELEEKTMQECANLEGVESFRAWWESDAVPTPSKYSVRIAMIRARIDEWKAKHPTSEIEKDKQNVGNSENTNYS